MFNWFRKEANVTAHFEPPSVPVCEQTTVTIEPPKTNYKYNVGQLLVIRTTGEKVCVMSAFSSWATRTPCYWVRRPSVSKEGFINHENMSVEEFELATIEEFGNAQVDEILLKDKIEDRLQEARRESRSAERIDTSIN